MSCHETLDRRKVTPTGESYMKRIRRDARTMYMTIETFCKPSRELNLALTKLEECVMWANKAISNQRGLVIYDEADDEHQDAEGGDEG